ncbi:MAG: prephenate dehydratase [Snowella sp.]|nr:prephenate dehydratase [Snowella sp.]
MSLSIAHLGPKGTNAETAAIAYADWLQKNQGQTVNLIPYPSIAQTIYAGADQAVDLAIVPVENSTEGGIAITLDALWERGNLQIQQELVLPIIHVLLSRGIALEGIQTVYSHPQALGQCQKWLEHHLPQARLIASNSTTEAIQFIQQDPTSAAIASPRAAKLYDFPVLAADINDYPDNCTRFWVLGLKPSLQGSHTALAFSFPANVPGALVRPLQIFANRNINLSRIESRPTKRSLGEYLFFMDLESSQSQANLQEALAELKPYTEILKVFGSYYILSLQKEDRIHF